MAKLGVRCVRRAVSGAALTGFGKAAYACLLLVLSCVLSPAFAQAFEGNGCTPEMKVKKGNGIKGDPYKIGKLCQLQDISSSPTAYYELVADIDASETKDWNNSKGFEPIASGEGDGFSGSFVNASTHKISSLTISRSGINHFKHIGLFSKLAKGATIRSLILVDSRVTAGFNSYAGLLVGSNFGVIEGCSATGSVSGVANVGGLVGLSSGEINNSYAAASVSGRGNYVGGLAGWVHGNINSSYAAGSVSGRSYFVGGLAGWVGGDINSSYATASVSGQGRVGGLVGQVYLGEISNSYATGSVSGISNYVGGLAGLVRGNINSSYATGSVSGISNYVGGLVGWVRGDINSSYATGSVSGVENVGGLVGSIPNGGSIRNSYYAARGRTNGFGKERTFAQLRCPMAASEICPPGSQESTYEDWDANVWNFGSATGLPQLLSNQNSDLNLKPYIKSSTSLLGIGIHGATHFSLKADYPGTPRESATLTWSLLFDEPPTLSGFVYFDLGNGTTSTEANGFVPTLTVVVSDDTIGKGFYVVLKNNISADDDRVQFRIAGLKPLVDGGREQTGEIWEGSTRTILKFSATDPDSPGSGGAGLSWSFLSTDVAEGSTVVFSSTQKGGTVEVEVSRGSLDLYDVGSFVLEVESPVGVKTMVTVTVETVCSPELGTDLMTEQTGTGKPDDRYRIERLCQLQDISSSLTAHYELVAGIDASRTKDWNGRTGFKPIASTETGGFSGSFVNASNHVISSLTISHSDTDNVGLFSRLAKGATIRGVILVGSRTDGRNNAGPLVGYNNGVIEDSSATGLVSGSDSVGGLVGYNHGSINNSHAASTVTGTGSNVGGLVGRGDGNINNSYATGLVSGRNNVGSLVGVSLGSVSNSYATGSVVGAGNYIGGLVGRGDGNINNSYATGSVSGRNNVGGLMGVSLGSVSNSYATGSVVGAGNYIGGLVGESVGDISNSYATGSVSGRDRVGGLVGKGRRGGGGITNSYYAARGWIHDLGEVRTFTQLRCPTMFSATCPPDSQESVLSYIGWDPNVWDFGSITDLPQLSSNRNLDLNRKPYIKSHTELVVRTGFPDITRFSLEADVPGTLGKPVTLTWSLLFDASSAPSGLAYFVREDGTTSVEVNGSAAMLSVVRDGRLAAGMGFYVVLKNNVSASDDRIRVQIVDAPYIIQDDDIGLAYIESTTTFSFSAGYEGTLGQFVGLRWSLFGVPTTLHHLVYFDLGDGTTSTTFSEYRRLTTGDAATVMLVVVGDEGLAGKSFHVVLKSDISDYVDRVRVEVEESKQPYILRSDIDPVGVEGATTYSFSVGYAGTPGERVTLTWSLLFDETSTPRDFAYFVLEDGSTSRTFVDSRRITTDASMVTLVVVGNEELAGKGLYVVLKNDISGNVDRIPVRIVGASPLVVGGREQTGMIWGGSTSILSFSAIDRDSPDSDGAGLSWGFVSKDGIAEGSTVVFSGSTRGGVVEVEVRRDSLDFYDVGSFVLEVKSPADVRTTFTVTIETVCSPELGADLMAGQAGKGTPEVPYQIKRLCQLQDINSNPTAHYELAAGIDARRTKDWNDGAGFEPIGGGYDAGFSPFESTGTSGFSGSFVNASNHVISSLTISRSGAYDPVGLFSILAGGATIQGIRLVGSRTTGNFSVGSLVGSNEGVIEDCSATGSVVGSGDHSRTGGLVGYSDGDISNSSATGSVSGVGEYSSIGGLAGYNYGSISNSSATGSVVGSGNYSRTGGLAGYNYGSISNSSATGSVVGSGDDSRTGGLAGYNYGDISNSSATGSVSGTGNDSRTGGLVGYNYGDISNSYATGSVSGAGNDSRTGGLVGYSNGDISNSYATGSVSGTGYGSSIGGLVGYSDGDISNSYATGSVSGTGNDSRTGGLVGYSNGDISNSYATGSVSGTGNDSRTGGLVGYQRYRARTSNSYATGSVVGTGNDSRTGGLVGYSDGDISNSYATGSVSGTGNNSRTGGLVGYSDDDITNSYYAARGRIHGLGEARTFTQLRCPTTISATCSPGFQESVLSYKGWDANVWDFGSITELPQLSSNRNSDLNRKPYIKSHTELVVRTGFPDITRFSLEADVPGTLGKPVTLTWSLLFDASSAPSGLAYFVREDGTTSVEVNGSAAMFSVVRDDRLAAGMGFYVVLKNNVSANDDRIRVRTEDAPYIVRDGGDIGLADVESTTTFSFSAGYEGTLGQFVDLRWSLFGVPTTLHHLVYFDLGDGTTSTTFFEYRRLTTGDAATVMLVVVGDERLAGKSFHVVLKSNISDYVDRVRVEVEESKQPYILRSDIDPVGVEGATTYSFSVGYAGTPGERVTLTWSLLFDETSTPRDFAYFVLEDGSTSRTFVDSGRITTDASMVTLVVVGNEELAGKGLYVVLKNDISGNVDRIPVRIVGASPLVVGGREQTGMIWGGSTSILSFSAIDRDSPDSDGAGLSWGFVSKDGIAEGSTVVFSGSTRGGVVEVEVRRDSLDFYDVGSFVLEVKSPADVRTTFTVTIETVCSPELGADLMAGQAGKGTPEVPYQIKRLCQLQDINSNPTAHYELAANIDASRTRDWNNGAGFEPIGGRVGADFEPIVSGVWFPGSFVNASNHVISSLTISRSGAYNPVGLFSRLVGNGKIEGIRLVGSRTTGGFSVGSLVGYNEGVIKDCSATGSVSGTGNNSRTGGLVGYSDGDISNSSATGSVSGTGNDSRTGGLVGYQGYGSSISNSYATGSVSGTGNDSRTGGLVGYSNGDISNSYATGSVSGTGDDSSTGGLVGYSNGDISNSYATGSVSGTGDDSSTGGLVGYQEGGSGISNSYATGSVSGTGGIGVEVGGLVGYQRYRARISNSYATGSVSGTGNNSRTGGLVGYSGDDITNSYYAARGRIHGLGEARTFTQLRCPTTISATCPPDSQESVLSYIGWDPNVWDFGSITDLPQLSSNRNSDLNRKPYIKSHTELVVRTGFPDITRFSLEADVPGTLGKPVTLTWSLLFDASSAPSGLAYFVREDGTTSVEVNGSAAMFSVVRDDRLAAGMGFYVVLKNNVSANDDRIRVRTEDAPYIVRDGGDIGLADVEGTTTFSFSAGYEGTLGQFVDLRWSLFGVPTTLHHLVYFDLGDGTTSTTFFEYRRLTTGDAATVMLVVVGDERLAGKSFHVVLKSNISDYVDRVRVEVEESKQPYILRSDIDPVGVEGATTYSFSVGYAGTPGERVTLTWSLLFDETSTPRGFAYFVLEDGSTSRTFVDSGRITADASMVTLVVVGNEELAGKGFYVVLKNDISGNVDRIPVRIVGAIPSVVGGREQTRMIWGGSTRTILRFSATDLDRPDFGGVGLSWSFLSTDIAQDSTVRFSGTQRGGVVEVEVRRDSLDLYDVGSFVLEVKSPADVRTTFTVTIETVCSTELGADLMAGQTGRGTPENPYQIKNLCQLQDVGSNLSAHYELAADIDASRTKDWNNGEGFEPIAFTAVNGFEGSFVSTRNYVISSLMISRSDAYRPVGLFSVLAGGAAIQGVILVGSRTTGDFSVGSLVGYNGGVIEDCSATGSVVGEYGSIGGLVGYSNGSISNSYATGSVFGRRDVGGLAGYSGGDISNSYATGSVSGTGDDSSIGGLVGLAGGGISNSYATGSVFGTGDNVGGLVGNQVSSSIVNSYRAARSWNNGLGEERAFAQLRCPRTPSAFCQSDSRDLTYERWDANVWDFGSATDLPQLSSNWNPNLNLKPYIKGSAEVVAGTGLMDITQLSLEADYPGTPRESVILTWSLLFDEPSTLSKFVYFELENGTTSKEANGSVSTLAVVVSDDKAGKGFYVVLKNNISATDDRVQVRIAGLIPLVDGGREQIGKIWEGSTRTILRFSATDLDSPGSGGVGLSWSFLSADVAEGSTVVFSSSTRGGVVEVEVRRDSLDFYDVGSFVLEVESPAGAKTTFTVTIETMCSTELGADLMAGQAGKGRPEDPYQIKRLCQLQDISSSPTAHYELAAGIDASRTKDWNNGEGFEPIGGRYDAGFRPFESAGTGGFSGSFVNASNHVISSLTISRSGTYNPVGLFSRLVGNGKIEGIRLVGSRTTGNFSVGSLVGSNEGVIKDCSATGSVVGEYGSIGGLVGYSNGSISNSYATGSVFGRRDVGGLAGYSNGDISNSYATGSVVGVGEYSSIGGLVGYSDGGISNSYATGSVSGTGDDSRTGGLVGYQGYGSNISNSYATGSVSGTGNNSRTGGLVGYSSGSISNSSATGSVVGTGYGSSIGGLVGYQEGGSGIGNSYATGSVSGTGNNSRTGGLVGYSNGDISNSYATGSVSGTGNNSRTGGLVGYQRYGSSISNSYATGSVSGTGNNSRTGGLVGYSDDDITNSYYAARGRIHGLGEARTFTQLRCPTTISATCSPDFQESVLSYKGWDANVWDFGSITELPQLSSNRNSDLNRKPYIKSHTELVVGTGFPGITRFSLEADGSGTLGKPVTLTWSLLFDASSTPSGLAYFVREDGTTSVEVNGSAAMFSVVRDDRLAAGMGFYVVLKNNVSANDDRIRVRTEDAPYIVRDGGDIGLADVESTTTFSFSAGYEGTLGQFVDLRWSLFGVPTTLHHLVYFDLGDGTTSTTFFEYRRLTTGDAATVMLVVVGDERLAGKSFHVVLKSDISDYVDRVRVEVEESKQPHILRSDIDPVGVEGATTYSFSVGYAGTPGERVTLTWSLLFDETSTPRDFAYFVLEDGSTSRTFVDSGRITTDASMVTLVVVGNEELAGKGLYVVLKNDISGNVDRIPVRIVGASPLVVGGREQTGMIWGGSTSILSFSAIDRDSPDSDGAGLSWGFVSKDGIAEGSTVVFSGSTRGGVIEVEVRRDSLDFYDVGSFVLEVKSPADVRTTFTVTIETVCSPELGADLMAGQAGKGTPEVPYQIKRLCQLQDINSNPTAHYELAAGIDARRTKDWNDGAGFEPIGGGYDAGFSPFESTGTSGFSGSFVNASNHVISSLTISRSGAYDPVGLFSILAGGATIQGIRLVGSRTTGNFSVGSLVGSNEGVIEDCSATGSVVGEYSSIGGLVGYSNGSISNSYATGSVFGRRDVGGLAGYSNGSISNSYATGSVFGRRDVGGLAGYSNGDISNSYATGSVSGQGSVGGLVGVSLGIVSNSSATGSVSGVGEYSSIGGLVGVQRNESSVIASYATGSVVGTGNDSRTGGLVGSQEGRVRDSYATGSVSGTGNDSRTGGLVGSQEGSVRDSYATGSVSGTGDDSSTGGLVGYQRYRARISNSYATGSVSGAGDDSSTGGLLGYQGYGSSISNSYATGSVFGTGDNVGGLVGNQVSSSIVNSYHAARGWNNGLGEERAFARLRCPRTPGAFCQSDSRDLTYERWDANVWDFGSATDLPQLLSNRNPNLNLKPYIKGSAEVVAGTGLMGITQLSLEADYPGTPRESVILTWSLLFDEPPTLSKFVYFELENGTTSREANGSVSTLAVVVSDDKAGKGFYVVLKNNISATDDRVQVRIAGLIPLVDGGREQIGKIWEGSTRTILRFSATDLDSPGSGGVGLSWSFLSTDVAEGSTVVFSSSTRGGVVEVEVRRDSLDFYDVGSFVLEVESPAGAKTTFTVTIETMCSTELGADLMAGQTGKGMPEDPYQIKRLCQLQDISSSPTAHYELAAGIDASRTKDWNYGAGFEPIGGRYDAGFRPFESTGTGGFSGSFMNASAHVISSLTISRSGAYNPVGLFSRLVGNGKIEGIRLVDSRTTGNFSVGSLVGLNEGVIKDCSATGSVVGEYGSIGGLVGYSNGSISNSYATGSVFGRSDVGGLAGYSNGDISNSYATGSVVGVGEYSSIGGLVGYSDGGIGNSYATGSVSGTGNDSHTGGLVGYQGYGSSISNSYATGSVFGADEYSRAGGLVGYGDVEQSETVNSYYAARGWRNGLGEERAFAQLRCPRTPSAFCQSDSRDSTYEGWDANVWDFGGATDLPQLSSNWNPNLNLKPYIKGSAEVVAGTGLMDITQLSLEADYPGTPRESVILTWSLLFDEPPTLSKFVYFELENGTTSKEANGSVSTLAVVVSDDKAGKGFYVVLKNNISATDDRVQVRIAGLIPLVDGGREQIGKIWEGSTRTILRFSATDLDSPGSGGVGLSWSFLSTDVAEGSTVVFSSSTRGGVVEVEVRRDSLDFYDVGSFVLEVESPAGAKTTFTVTIETMCSTELGADLMAGQTGKGMPGDPYQIKRLCQLQDISSSPTAYYELVAGIDASRTKDWNYGAGFEPIGGRYDAGFRPFESTGTGGFSGSFVNASAHVISSLTISRSGAYNPVGLFSRLVGNGKIEGIRLVGSRTTGDFSVGSLVGLNEGVIKDCSATGSVSGVGEYSSIGGLVGYSDGGISNSYATGSVSGTGYGSSIGGLVGYQEGESGIGNSYATGSVSGQGSVGGLVGVSLGIVSNSYATGSVSGTGNDSHTGGLVGYQGYGSSISNSYATGSVFGADEYSRAGGLVGYGDVEQSETVNSYYAARGWRNGLGEERTFAQLRCPRTPSAFCQSDSRDSTYEGWDANVWDFGGATDLPQLSSNWNPNLNLKPYIKGSAEVVAGTGLMDITQLSLEADYPGTPRESVTLTWSLSGVPATLRHLVYFDLGGDTTSTTFTESAKFTDSASTATLVVEGNKELAGISFYVVLRNNISANDDRVRVQVGEEKQPYIFRNDDIRQAGVEGNTTFSLSVDYAGPAGQAVTLSWSLFGVPAALRHLVYFDLGGDTTSTTFTESAKFTDSAGTATLVVEGNKELAGISFYVVLRNNISANDDRVRVQVGEEKQPYILQSDDIRQAGVEVNTTFSLSVAYAGTPEVPVTLSWSLFGVPAALRHLVYFDLGGDTTSTTFTESAKFTDSAGTATLVVEGNKELAGISFYVVLKNDISAKDDRVRVDVEEEKQPYILQSDDIRQAGVEVNTTFSLSVAYAGTPEVPVTLSWSLFGVPAALRHLVYFDLGGNTTSTTFTESAKFTDSASPVTLVVEGNKELAGISFYVVLKNDISVKDDRVRVDVEEEKQPYILQSDDIRQAGVEVNTTFSLSVAYAGTPEVPVTLSWSLFGVPAALRHLVYFDLGGNTTSTTFTESAKFTDSASTVTLVVVGNKELAGISFYVVLKNDISAKDDRVRVDVEEEKQPYVLQSDDIRQAGVEGNTTFSLSVGYAGTPEVPVTLSWSLSGVPAALRHLVYFDLGDGTTSTTVTDIAKLTDSASPVTLVVVGNKGLAGRSFYVVLRNDISANDDRVRVQVEEEKQPYILQSDDIRQAGVEGNTTFSLSVGYAGTPGKPVTLTWSLSGVPAALRHLVYFDLGGDTTSTTFTESAKFTDSAGTATLVVEGNKELAGISFYVVLKNDISAKDDRVPVQIGGAYPSVDSKEVQTVWDGSTRTTLMFSATDHDSPDDGSGLSWDFFSTDRIAEGSAVRFNSTQKGSVVEVEVRRRLDLRDVGSFVLGVESRAGVKTTFTVTVKTVCSSVPGADLMAGQAGTGTSDDPYQIKRLCQLQDVSSSPSAHYELAADIDGNSPRMLNGGTGFEPIASTAADGFSGSFVSTNSYVISSLTISRSSTDNVGLFSRLAAGATIRGVILVGSRTTGRNSVGSLVGFNSGVIEGCSATGSVSGVEQVGGLVGFSSGDISGGFAAGSVRGLVQRNAGDASASRRNSANLITGGDYVGGLVGISSGVISDSSAIGSVSGGNQVGGLVGFSSNRSSIDNSYASSTVTGTDFVGGLVGSSSGGISDSSATGSVSGGNQVGGLVGRQVGSSIRNSYAASNVKGAGYVGGLVGSSSGEVSRSSATGSVSGVEQVGGLVGRNEENGSVSRSYAASMVTGRDVVGGLVGSNEKGASVSQSVAASTVTGSSVIGGLVGSNEKGATVTQSVTASVVTGDSGDDGLVGAGDGDVTDSSVQPDSRGVLFEGWDLETDGEPELRSVVDSTAKRLRVKVYLGGAVR